MKIKIQHNGFTLIELLAVILVFSIISSIGATILITSLRSTSKTNILTDVKQNGNFALAQMTKLLRDATNVSNCSIATYPPPALNSISFTGSDGSAVALQCDDAINHRILYSNSGQQVVNQPFIDTTSVWVTSGSCSFTCSQTTASDYPVVTISFSLQSANSNVVEKTVASIPFTTSITLRNKNR